MVRHLIAVYVTLTGCNFVEDLPIGGSILVSGSVVDFQSRAQLSDGVGVTVSGLQPEPSIETTGSSFQIDRIPENSVFQIRAEAAAHQPTFSDVITVIDQDIADLEVPVVSEPYLESLATTWGVPADVRGGGVLFARLVDAGGAPRAGVTAQSLAFTGGPAMLGPFFLDAGLMPLPPTTTASSGSGWVVYFGLAAGSVSVGIAAQATITVEMATSAIEAGAVTLATAKVTDGPPPSLPTNVSFATQVFPIFGEVKDGGRGCVACHSANGVGKQLGNLSLNAANLAFKELAEDPRRVNLGIPQASLVLTKPLREEPPNHQNATFASPSDPDYLKILVWIREGAKNN